MRVLVTGGAGFIGSNFIRYLLNVHRNIEAINFDKLTYAGNAENLADLEPNTSYSFVRGDIADRNAVDHVLAQGIDVIVNFAAETHVDRSIEDGTPFLRTNILGTHTLLESARNARGLAQSAGKAQTLESAQNVQKPVESTGEAQALESARNARTLLESMRQTQTLLESAGNARIRRFIHISTDEVYGSAPAGVSFSEQAALNPRNPYAASKAAADHFVSAYANTFGMPTIILRCTNNYGPYQFPEKLIPLAITHANADKRIPLYGDGAQERDWLFVEDCCRAITLAFEKATPGSVYNISGGTPISNLKLVRTILAHLEKPESLIRHVQDRPGHDRRYSLDSSKIRHELGWAPQIGLEEGIPVTVEWYKSHAGWLEHAFSGAYRKHYERQYIGRKDASQD